MLQEQHEVDELDEVIGVDALDVEELRGCLGGEGISSIVNLVFVLLGGEGISSIVNLYGLGLGGELLDGLGGELRDGLGGELRGGLGGELRDGLGGDLGASIILILIFLRIIG
jgi:hypothetical protein